MKISTKMTLNFIVICLFVFGVYGFFTVHSEKRDLMRVAQQNTEILGNSIRVAAENALRDRQLSDINELLRKIEKTYSDIHIFVFDPSGVSIATRTESGKSAELMQMASKDVSSSEETFNRFIKLPKNDSLAISLGSPLIDDNGTNLGRMIIIRTLTDLEEDLSQTNWNILILVISFVCVLAISGHLIGIVYIHRPLNRLIQAIDQVKKGDVLPKLVLKQRDEIGRVATKFNKMTEDLAIARNKLEKREEEKRDLLLTLQRADKLITVGQLSSGLAHEIGSPLQVLSGRARDMLEMADQPVVVRRNAQILIDQVDRIVKIVQQLLDFSRKRRRALQTVDMTLPVKQVVDLLQFEAHRKNVRLLTKLDESLPHVSADADEIQQVLVNLILNALEATPSGGTIEVSLKKDVIHDQHSGTTSEVSLSVTDTGSGMAEDLRAKIFQPFFTTRSSQGGTGLGLAIVKSIVNDHEGQITCESHVGLGTRFTILLPSLESLI